MDALEVDAPESVKPPRDAYRFWPLASYALYGTGKKIQRLVFEKQQFCPLEAKKVAKLESAIQQGKVDSRRFPPYLSKADLVRFCHGTNWKTKGAVKVLNSYLDYRSKMPADYRLLFVKVKQFLHTAEDYVTFLYFILEYVINQMMLPGQVENWVFISDMGRRGLMQLNTGKIKQVTNVLTANFRCRLGTNHIVRTPTSFRFIWIAVKPFMDDALLAKIKVNKGDTPVDLLANCHPSQVEQQYGGTAPNLEVFWPPCMPDGPLHNPQGEYRGTFGTDTFHDYFPHPIVDNSEPQNEEQSSDSEERRQRRRERRRRRRAEEEARLLAQQEEAQLHAEKKDARARAKKEKARLQAEREEEEAMAQALEKERRRRKREKAKAARENSESKSSKAKRRTASDLHEDQPRLGGQQAIAAEPWDSDEPWGELASSYATGQAPVLDYFGGDEELIQDCSDRGKRISIDVSQGETKFCGRDNCFIF